jgi:hypothetical protein
MIFRTRRIALGLALAMLLASAGADPACGSEACSCVVPDIGFLVMTGAEIPLDSRGIPWAGALDREDNEPVLPAASSFSIERVVEGGRIGVPVELELLTGPPVGDGAPFSMSHLLVVRPRGGFAAGGQYLFRDYGGQARYRAWRTVEMPHEVVVSVSDSRLADAVAAAAPASLETREHGVAELRVMTTCGSCSVSIDAAQTGISLRLPAELRRWSDVLLYTTTVDGESIWRPQRHLCSRVAPGESWTGRGSELVFASCGTVGETRCRPSYDLANGEHEVEMTAWWPGVDASVSARANVELTCDQGPE